MVRSEKSGANSSKLHRQELHPFQAHRFLPGGQCQTIGAWLWGDKKPWSPDQTIEVSLNDGDKLILGLNQQADSMANASPIVYLLHGLGGDMHSTYMLRLGAKLKTLGYRVVRHNHRGAGEYGHLAKNIYHSGSALDLAAGLQAIAERWPQAPIYAVGFSLSGTMLLNYLARHWQSRILPQLKAAAVVCSPVNLEESSLAIDAWQNKHLDLFYVNSLVRQLSKRGMIDRECGRQLKRKPSLRHFDEVFTARRGGFQNRDHYYQQCSPEGLVAQINCPLYVVAAHDDPIVPSRQIEKASWSRSTTVEIAVSGGHLGFISRQKTRWNDHRWMDEALCRWLESQVMRKS